MFYKCSICSQFWILLWFRAHSWGWSSRHRCKWECCAETDGQPSQHVIYLWQMVLRSWPPIILEKSKIHSVGIKWKNWLAGCVFTNNKEMKAKGWGTFEEIEAKHDNITISAVKWYDNGGVALLSTFAAANPTPIVDWWDKKRKEMTSAVCANIVTVYKSMGGVHLLDSLIVLHKSKIKEMVPQSYISHTGSHHGTGVAAVTKRLQDLGIS